MNLQSPIIIIIIAAFFVAVIIVAIVLSKLHRKRVSIIAQLEPEVQSAFKRISKYYSYNHYVSESERLSLKKEFHNLSLVVRPLLDSKELEKSPHKELFQRFYEAMTHTSAHKKTNNEHFIEKQLHKNSLYFDTILQYPLDTQQRVAIVSLEDNVLVISSAGSGKTMTTVGKVRYLIDVQHVPAEKILLITFTRKAAESLSERLGEKDLKCRTFHKLALDIIGEATGEKPTITDKSFSAQVYERLFKDNADFRRAIVDYIIRSRYTMKDQFEYSSMQEYMKDRNKYGVKAFYRDMDGRSVFCKSDEESKICDFLGSRGIKFRYEERYEFDTTDGNFRQYCPDFSIYIDGVDGKPERIYLEHFAINEQGHCPPWFSKEDEDKYHQGILWKRLLHRNHGTILLETSSAGFHRGDVFKVLGEQLLELGAVFSTDSHENISRQLAHQEETILDMLKSFNFLLKSRDRKLEDISPLIDDGQDRITFNDVVAPFVEEYRRMEEERDEIDFTDAIIRATDLCNNGYRPDYDYILVDEFQDISMDRYRFLQALRREKPLTKLFCVGDDWQSIYRFAGSDMSLFKQFEQYFGYTKKCFMETTYRFGEPAIAESSRFILANPEQQEKMVHSFNVDAETKLDFLAMPNKETIIQTVKDLLDQVPEGKDVILLGRYHFDVNVLKGSSIIIHESHEHAYITYKGRNINFLTVHQSKGLESDYVILLNCNGGMLGFPSQISDSPILKYVLSTPDPYLFSEERRVFYVGITRAKKQTWVLYNQHDPSPFVKEFTGIAAPVMKTEEEPDPHLCPKCQCGRIRVAHKGVASNGNPYSILVCSNEKFGCDYREMVFVNLNRRSRR